MLRLQRCFPFALALAGALLATLPSPSAGQSAGDGQQASAPASDLLRPGDLVRLRIWREPDLSGDFPVDVNGIVVFPMLGPLQVTEETSGSLKAKLVAAYQEYLKNPSIDVLPLRRVNILGAVKAPGLYPLDATMTLADALALAGGSTPQGDPDKIDLIRGGERLTTRLSQGTRIGDLPIRSGDQLFVPERSWISRNSGVVATVISASVSLVIALFIR